MKKLSILMFAFVAFTGLTSCSSDDDVVFIAQPDIEGISFVNSFNSNYVLTAATATNIAERFVWNTVDFGTPTNITYELEGSSDATFLTSGLVLNTSENNLAVTVAQLMALAEDAGLDNDPNTDASNTGTLYFRVKAYAGTDGSNALSETSEVKSLTVTLPETGEMEEVFKNLFLVGSATATEWNNSPTSNNYPLFRDAVNPNIYHYTGKLTGGEDMGFKLIEVKGLWAPQYGGANGTLVYRPTDADTDPAPIPVSTTGYYTITVDIDELTYTVEPYDASGKTTYDIIGLVGDGTTVGWPGDSNPTPDIKLTKSTFDEHIWFARGIELTDGPVKFRANLEWSISWGGGENFPSGLATNDDIMAKEGTYDVWFNDLTGRYIFIKL
ncbi:MAG TPA: SusF/SusE family outer membrane protein [Gillisia sp.]|nr:SusF/SusE family outer membrane protein [Gillisia sp.]